MRQVFLCLLQILDEFADSFSHVPGSRGILARLFRNPAPEEFWGVVGEVLVARHLRQSDYHIERFGEKIVGTGKDADLLLRRDALEILLDVESKAPANLDKTDSADALVESATSEAADKVSAKFSGADDPRLRVVCLVWRPSAESLSMVDSEPQPWLPHVLASEDGGAVVHHLRTVIGWSSATQEPHVLLQDLIPGCS